MQYNKIMTPDVPEERGPTAYGKCILTSNRYSRMNRKRIL